MAFGDKPTITLYMPRTLYRVKLSTVDPDDPNVPRIISEYVATEDDEQAERIAQRRCEERGIDVTGVSDVEDGMFVPGLRYPTPRPEARWEEVDTGCRWRFEFAHRAFVYLSKTEGEGYLAWLELNGVPCNDDSDLIGCDTLEQAKRGACGFAASALLSMLMLLNREVVSK